MMSKLIVTMRVIVTVTVTVTVPVTVAMAMIVAVVMVPVAVAMAVVAQDKKVERIDSYPHQSQCKHHCRKQVFQVSFVVLASQPWWACQTHNTCMCQPFPCSAHLWPLPINVLWLHQLPGIVLQAIVETWSSIALKLLIDETHICR